MEYGIQVDMWILGYIGDICGYRVIHGDRVKH